MAETESKPTVETKLVDIDTAEDFFHEKTVRTVDDGRHLRDEYIANSLMAMIDHVNPKARCLRISVDPTNSLSPVTIDYFLPKESSDYEGMLLVADALKPLDISVTPPFTGPAECEGLGAVDGYVNHRIHLRKIPQHELFCKLAAWDAAKEIGIEEQFLRDQNAALGR